VHLRVQPNLWVRQHPFAADLALATALWSLTIPSLFVTNEVSGLQLREPDVLGLVLATMSCLPLACRRRWPMPVLVVIVVPLSALAILDYSTGVAAVSLLIAVYTVAVHCARPVALAGLAATSAAWLVIVDANKHKEGAVDVIAILGVTFAAWAFGRSVGFRRAYTAELEARAERLERSQEADTVAALAEERGRIARELHDVVAHHVSVMTVQASAAQRMLGLDPSRSREAMAAVEETGRAALTEMRRIVGVLRSPREDKGKVNGATLGPQPGVGELDDLVTQVREAGLDVEFAVEGQCRALAPGVDLAAYRIVQEALTNTLKHAGPTRSKVLLRYDSSELLVRVVDDGHGLAASLSDSPSKPLGHGLLGMRERVSLYGGRLYAGPRAGGGFEVLARIPLEQMPA
jgi:signal transduction histidine kinase